ncbi:MAG: hypothetical protein LBN95_02635 [Prevotellaceae bacterium]|jgi:hypothetical protein|nr:hypothetical protein [Prevotellaceae bacterium]
MGNRDYTVIKNEKPTIPFSDSRSVLKTMDDGFWKWWIFHFLLLFYERFDRVELKLKLEKTSRVEKTIADFINNYLKKNEDFDWNCGFKINREPLTEGNIEGYYDIKIEHSCWNKMFCFECKNIDDKPKSRLISEYVNNGVYRYFNGKYAQNQDFGGMIGFVLQGDTQPIKDKIIKKLENKFDISPEGDLKNIVYNSIEDNEFTFNSTHQRKGECFTLHHLLFDIR